MGEDSIATARDQRPRLIDRRRDGVSVTITRRGKAVARVVAIDPATDAPPRARARRGQLQENRIGLVDASLDAPVARPGGAFPMETGDSRRSRALIFADGVVRAPEALHIVAPQRPGASLATFDLDQARAARAVGIPVDA